MASFGPLDPNALLILGILLAVVGFLLAFIGRKMWTPFMSLVGAIIGGVVGYVLGAYFVSGNILAAGILALIGSVLGSILFNYLVKIALALIAAGIPAAITYYSLRGGTTASPGPQDTPVIAAVVVLVFVFAITYYFVEELIGIVTSLVGGALLGTGVYLATGNTTFGLVAGGAVFLVGAVLQTLAIRAAKKGGWRMQRARAAAMANPQYLQAPTAPPSAAPPPSSTDTSARPPPPPPP